ncbi:MAG: FlgD immunoglobulin-like domain containing protein [Actinomycetota bacterium]
MNPRTGSAVGINYSFTSTYWTTVTVMVKDSSGNVVRTLDREQAPSGSFSPSWDGKDSNGVPAPDGTYSIVAAPAGYVYSSTLGSPGSGDGQLTRPWGVGIDSSGNVWVGDAANNRFEEFKADGSYLAQIPYANALTIHPESDGSLDVANGSNVVNRIKPDGTALATYSETNDPTNAALYDLQPKSNGDWLFTDNRLWCCWGTGAREIGSPWNTTTSTVLRSYSSCCKFEALSDLGNGTTAMSTDSGQIQYVDSNNNNYWGASNFCFPNAYGCPGFGPVYGITSDGTDTIASFYNRNQIAEFPYQSTSPLWVLGNGAGGQQQGQFFGPMGVALSGGNLYVADQLNNRIEVYTPAQPVSVPVIVDTRGPTVSSASVNPSLGGGGILSATIDDTATGNTPIAAAEVFMDTTGPDGSGQLLNAQDGSFDQSVEAVFGYVTGPPTPSVPPTPDQVLALHKLFIHGRDAAGNWGGFRVLDIAVTPAGIVSLPS